MTRGNRITRDAHFGLDETTCSTHPDRAKREPDHWRGLHRHGRHRSAFSGVGNFSGVAGEEVYDIANNQLTGAAGIAPVHAASASDLVLRNANTGAFEVYDIAGNQLIGAASLGQVGLDWQLGGFAADPPTLWRIRRHLERSLVQAMAGFGGGGTTDGLNAIALGTERHSHSY